MGNIIVSIAKWMLIIECSLVILFVLINYSIRIYHYLLLKEKRGIEDQIKDILMKHIIEESELSPQDMSFFDRHILNVLKVYESLEVSEEYLKNWNHLKSQIEIKLFYPRGRKLYQSWRAYKRYYAARCFFAHFEESDAPMVIKLIEDPVLLVSLNASRVAFKYHSPVLINASIDVFSKYRKIRQATYSTIAHECSENVEKIVVDRLVIEKDPYIKAFCYRLLQQLPATELFTDQLITDLNSDILDLSISALHYCGYNPACRHYLGKYIDSEIWQMRAVAAEWIGKTQYTQALPALTKRLSDHEWWVRIRAAEALGRCGEMGIQSLKAVSSLKDKYAYEAAQQVLEGIMDKERVTSC